MSVIVIDGPEKAGKTTIIIALVKEWVWLKKPVIVRHFGPVNPDDRVYSPILEKDATTRDYLAIWDRCWPSEYVYGSLGMPGNVNHRMVNDPWLGEWLHGRAVQACGLRVMVLGPDPKTHVSKRDESDWPVDPSAERAMYYAYAKMFGWFIIDNVHSLMSLDRSVKLIMDKYSSVPLPFALPPYYCGPADARVIFVGEKRSDKPIPGGWLPFTSRMTTFLGRLMEGKAFECGWTNAHDCPPIALRNAKTLIACGKKAQLWIKNYVIRGGGNLSQRVIEIPHPSYLFRYNNEATAKKRVDVEQIITKLKKEM